MILQQILIVCCCSWWSFWTPHLNTDWAADSQHWNIWTVDGKPCKPSSVIREYFQCATACSLEKVNFSLNCCISTKSESLAQISATIIAEMHNCF